MSIQVHTAGLWRRCRIISKLSKGNGWPTQVWQQRVCHDTVFLFSFWCVIQRSLVFQSKSANSHQIVLCYQSEWLTNDVCWLTSFENLTHFKAQYCFYYLLLIDLMSGVFMTFFIIHLQDKLCLVNWCNCVFGYPREIFVCLIDCT